MEDREVKGTMVLDMVRMIRANKDLPWDEYLDAEDWKVINSIILQSKWYPFGLYQRLGWAVFQVVAKGNLELVRARGRQRGKELFGDVYKSIVANKSPLEALDAFVKRYSTLFNFSILRFEKEGEKNARIYHDFKVDHQVFIAYCHQLRGHLEALVEMTGGKNYKVELIAKQWEGAPTTIFDITWQ